MIKKIRIDNFKSLVNFEVTLAKFTCLVGLNGAGKSTLLQAIDFLAQVMRGSLKDWLDYREWISSDVLCRLPERPHKRRIIEFEVTLFLDGQNIIWEGRYNADKMRCTWELIQIDGREILTVTDNRYRLQAGTWESIRFDYSGSILSRLKVSTMKQTSDALISLIDFFDNVKSMELLAPHMMRKRARQAGEIGVGGEKLSAFLYVMKNGDRQELDRLLKQKFSPSLHAVHTQSIKAGWKKLSIEECYPPESNKTFITEARHVNDGLLRQLAIIAQTMTSHRFLLFDEIENGMNPESIESLVQVLLESSQQVLVSTHNPLILNYLSDDVAREAVILLYRTPQGFTQAVHYFKIPLASEKLSILGPGEVYVDTYLEDIVRQAQEINKGSSGQGLRS